jgi:hypothetical protein
MISNECILVLIIGEDENELRHTARFHEVRTLVVDLTKDGSCFYV